MSGPSWGMREGLTRGVSPEPSTVLAAQRALKRWGGSLVMAVPWLERQRAANLRPALGNCHGSASHSDAINGWEPQQLVLRHGQSPSRLPLDGGVASS